MRRLVKRPLVILLLLNLVGVAGVFLRLGPAIRWPVAPMLVRYQVAELRREAPLDRGNKPRPVEELKYKVRDEIYLLAEPRTMVTQSGIVGVRLLVVNGTTRDHKFYASDHGLMMRAVAQVPDGTWSPIERLPWSSCGNSYHRVSLGPRQFWELPVPIYLGLRPTRLRYDLYLDDERTLSSNDFYGLIDHRLFNIASAKARPVPALPKESATTIPWTSLFHRNE
jgi:hypothetical protein